MQQYTKDFLRSRKRWKDDYIPCELCGKKKIADIHHINSSFRGKRTHNKDGSDIIGLCTECHSNVHQCNDSEVRYVLKTLVRGILQNVL